MVIALLCALLYYGRALGAFFIYDDFVWLECAATSGQDLTHIFNLHISGFFRPISHLLFAGSFALHGAHPLVFRVIALLLHGICAGLLARLAFRLTADRSLALVCALVFALNPSYQEVMLWISATNEALTTLLILVTLLGWHRLLVGQGNRGLGYALTLGAFVLALGTKESSVVLLPLMVLLHLGVRISGKRRHLSLWLYSPFLLLLGLYLLAQYDMQNRSGIVTSGDYVIGLHAIRRLFYNLWTFFKAIWPVFAAGALGLLLRRVRLSWMRDRLYPAFLLLLALVVVMSPYLMFTWRVMASRYCYMSAAVLGLLGALSLRSLLRSGQRASLALALLALLGLGTQGFFSAWRVTGLYRSTSGRMHHFIQQARVLPAAPSGGYNLIVDSPLLGQQLESAMRLLHISHSGRFIAMTWSRLQTIPQSQRVWRWNPVTMRLYPVDVKRLRRQTPPAPRSKTGPEAGG